MIALLTHPLARWLLGAAIAAAIIGTLYGAWQHEAGKAERYRLEAVAKDAELAAEKRKNVALERASAERAIDNGQVADMTKGIEDAIDKAAAREPGSPIGAATLAAGCERLRRAGQTASARYRSECR